MYAAVDMRLKVFGGVSVILYIFLYPGFAYMRK